MTGDDVFVIGDVHGHVDRLRALLERADIKRHGPHRARVIQLGDLGHFGTDTDSGDVAAWQLAVDGDIDLVLWGNHDRAVVDSVHHFSGFSRPDVTALHMMRLMEAEGRLLMAYEAHGWLLTHAGLHAAFKYQAVPNQNVDKLDARSIADWLNRRMGEDLSEPVIDAVGRARGGGSPYGGILWRDITEMLYRPIPQIFGHSASNQHIVRGEADKWYCLDIGGKGGPNDRDAECLAGMWLPSQTIVRVDKDDV